MIISGRTSIPQRSRTCRAASEGAPTSRSIGVPDEEMGEQVKAVVQPAAGAVPVTNWSAS
ncbi:hypothetical protein ACU686_16915 [Yinghuangia aomiensis]